MGDGLFTIVIKKKVLKRLFLLPLAVQKKLNLLLKDLRDIGPVLPHWPNYSKLGTNRFHCHLGYSWVACWEHEKESIAIEVYYVGSRESAPY